MKLFPRPLRGWTAIVVILCMSAINIGPAAAGLAPSRVSGAQHDTSTRAADLLTAQRALENKVVAQKLLDYGVAPAEAQARLVGMSDFDLHTLASATKGLPSGGDAAGGLIGVLVVVILVIVVLRLMHRDVVLR